MTDWKPLHTAPTGPLDADPIRILLWVANGNRNGGGIAAFGHAWTRHDGTVKANADGFLGGWEITHWAPEPEPPND